MTCPPPLRPTTFQVFTMADIASGDFSNVMHTIRSLPRMHQFSKEHDSLSERNKLYHWI